MTALHYIYIILVKGGLHIENVENMYLIFHLKLFQDSTICLNFIHRSYKNSWRSGIIAGLKT